MASWLDYLFPPGGGLLGLQPQPTRQQTDAWPSTWIRGRLPDWAWQDTGAGFAPSPATGGGIFGGMPGWDAGERPTDWPAPEPPPAMAYAAEPQPSPPMASFPAPRPMQPGAPISLPNGSAVAPGAIPGAEPGFLDRLGQGLSDNSNTLLAFAGGAYSGGIGEGLKHAARVGVYETLGRDARKTAERKLAMDRQSQLGTYLALKARGVSDRDAMAAALNPTMLKAVMPDLPSGFMASDGGLAPIPGGPADPTYLQSATEAKAKPADAFKPEQELRKEFESATKPHVEVRQSYNRVLASKNDAPGDIALIFGFMKMLDPGSVVREGEFATAQNSGGIPDTIRNAYNRALSGERLTPQQREGFKGQASAIYQRYDEEYKARADQFRGIAKQYGLDPGRVIPDIGPGPSGAASSKADPWGIR